MRKTILNNLPRNWKYIFWTILNPKSDYSDQKATKQKESTTIGSVQPNDLSPPIHRHTKTSSNTYNSMESNLSLESQSANIICFISHFHFHRREGNGATALWPATTTHWWAARTRTTNSVLKHCYIFCYYTIIMW
mgnify:CR=1 FL=1